MDRDSFLAEWCELHGGARLSPVVRSWLSTSYLIIKPFAKFNVSPDVITYFGLILGVFTWWSAHHVYSILFLVLCLISDGIDGSLAIATNSTTRWGAVLDSVVDRIVEFFWALTFITIGAPIIIVGIAWAAALVQEYVRSRAAGLGYRTISVVTISERPVRAIFLAIALALFFVHIHLVTWLASLWAIAQLFSLVVVLRDSYSALSSDN